MSASAARPLHDGVAPRWIACKGLREALRAAAIAAMAVLSMTVPAAAADAPTGRQIYEGTLPGYAARVRHADDASWHLPATQAACVACHRPSGLGSFEGGVAVPPIDGEHLFRPWDGATTHRYAWRSALRTRPAYDAAALRVLLETGRTPDGLTLSSRMPRYRFDAAEVDALAAHLRRLGAQHATGVDAETVHFATITSPEVSPAQRAALLDTLERYIAQKNADTRGETARRAFALRNERTMYRRHRRWVLHHWALEGDPSGWAAQLDALYARTPVYAVLSGVGLQSWQPVHEFCRVQRVPCLFPTLALPPLDGDFYSVYVDRGLVAQAEAAVRALQVETARSGGGQSASVQLLADDDVAGRAQAAAVREVLTTHGLVVQPATRWRGDAALVSLLDAPQTLARRDGAAGDRPVLLLAGMRRLPAGEAQASGSSLSTQAYAVSAQLRGAAADTQLLRTRTWMQSRGLVPADEAIAANALLAATAALETLMHADDRFSREYGLERLEHALENMPPLTAYPRLSLGPGQRQAAKAAQLHPLAGGATSAQH